MSEILIWASEVKIILFAYLFFVLNSAYSTPSIYLWIFLYLWIYYNILYVAQNLVKGYCSGLHKNDLINHFKTVFIIDRKINSIIIFDRINCILTPFCPPPLRVIKKIIFQTILSDKPALVLHTIAQTPLPKLVLTFPSNKNWLFL